MPPIDGAISEHTLAPAKVGGIIPTSSRGCDLKCGPMVTSVEGSPQPKKMRLHEQQDSADLPQLPLQDVCATRGCNQCCGLCTQIPGRGAQIHLLTSILSGVGGLLQVIFMYV